MTTLRRFFICWHRTPKAYWQYLREDGTHPVSATLNVTFFTVTFPLFMLVYKLLWGNALADAEAALRNSDCRQ